MLRYQEIKLRLKEEIAKMNANDKLPARPNLCTLLDTTRTTLDKAINELIEEGLLTAKNGSGTYVSAMQISNGIKQIGHWGVIVPNIMDAIYPGFVRSIENVAQGYDISVTLCNSDNDVEKQEQYIKRLILTGVSGFIIVPVITNNLKENYRLYSQLLDANIPFVFCNRSIDGIDVPVVTSNNFYGGYIATKHLINRGYQNIGFISRKNYRTSIERCQGYLSALMEAGITIDRENVIMQCNENTDYHVGYTEMTQMLNSDKKLDAVFCFNDFLVRGVYQAIKDKGLQVSKDIGIIGYDNEDFCEATVPMITSISYKNMEIGEKAAELLWKMVNNQPIPEFSYYLYQPEIVIRDSCKGPGL
jgi:DNA-binding LacI/PurR family transcriptional regulator